VLDGVDRLSVAADEQARGPRPTACRGPSRRRRRPQPPRRGRARRRASRAAR
jgi:hypothetical protein